MLFKRRHQPSLWHRISIYLWPRSGIRRSAAYLWHRIARLPGSTHSIAAGLASGMAVSFTPFLGVHFLMGFLLAWVTRGHLLASAIGTLIGNPWTFPFIFALTGGVGAMFHPDAMDASLPAFSFVAWWDNPWEYGAAYIELLPHVAMPFIIGGFAVGALVWLTVYSTLRAALDRYRTVRETRRNEKGSPGNRLSGDQAGQGEKK